MCGAPTCRHANDSSPIISCAAHPPAEVFEADFWRAWTAIRCSNVPSRYYNEAPARDHLDRLLYLDVKITLGDSDLPKVTQMSELAGIQTGFRFWTAPWRSFPAAFRSSEGEGLREALSVQARISQSAAGGGHSRRRSTASAFRWRPG